MPGSHQRPTTWGLRGSDISMTARMWSVKSGEMDRRIRITAAGVPDAVRPETVDRHEADLDRLLRPRNIVDADAGGKSASPILQLVGGRASEIRLLVLKFLHRPDAGRVDRQQQIVMGLQVKRARAGRTGDEIDHARMFRIAHVDGR